MEHNKKRRNSILKKPPTNEDDTTVDVTTKIKRRISFSGKKSVKEFIAGEEEATIWGTSYEESAEGWQAYGTEGGLVNVNEKRIVLRNRRVVVEPPSQGTKRRSKKKVFIAANDKENIFVQHLQVESPIEVEHLTKVSSPVQSELALVRTHLEDAKTQTMPEPVDRMRLLNPCSNTFDFINCSTMSNRTITIEHSVDVTLDENEIRMLKFRIPVSSTDVSPNLSLSSLKDGSSPNIFSRSILMTEDDVKMLKDMRKKTCTGVQLTEIGVNKLTTGVDDQNMKISKGVVEEMDLGQTSNNNTLVLPDVSIKQAEDKREAMLHMNQSKIVTKCEVPETNTSKRPTITTTVDMEACNNTTNRTPKGLFLNSVRTVESETDVKKRATLHMNQSMNVSRVEPAEIKSLKRKTITKAVSMEEASMRTNTLSKVHASDSSSMDINSPMRKKPMHNTTSKSMDVTTIESTSQGSQIRSQTIHLETTMLDEIDIQLNRDAPKYSRQTIHFVDNRMKEDSIWQNTDASCSGAVIEETQIDHNLSMELSMYDPPENESNKSSRLIEQNSNQVDKSKRRQSIHTHADMIADSPKATKSIHQTITTPADMMNESPKAKKSLQAAKSSRQTIYGSDDIIDDAPIPIIQAVSDPKISSIKQRKSIYSPTDIVEDSPTQSHKPEVRHHQTNATSGAKPPGAKQRQSIYTSTDIVEDSPKATKAVLFSKSNYISRKAISSSTEISYAPPQSGYTSPKASGKKRESIYDSADIVEDSPKATRSDGTQQITDVTQEFSKSTNSAAKGSEKLRKSIYTPADIIEDSPKKTQSTESMKSNIVQRQTTYAITNITQDLSTIAFPKGTEKSRQSIYTPADIIEDSPKAIRITETVKSNSLDLPEDPSKSTISSTKRSEQPRQSVYTPVDMMEDAPNAIIPLEDAKSNVQHRQATITLPEDFPKSTILATERQRQSIYTPSDMLEDSLKTSRQSIYTPSDILEDSPKASKLTEVLHHQTIKGQTEMDAGSPNAVPLATASAPKIVVKHMKLHQSVTGDQAALRMLKNRQAKIKLPVETKTQESCMDMSVFGDLSKSANKMNFRQLNDDMFRGETKQFTEERKVKISLFDNKQPEEVKFDSFMDKSGPIGCVIQPPRHSMKDYTMEFSMKKPLDSQRGRDSEYTMDLSLGNVLKPAVVKSVSSEGAAMELSMDVQRNSPNAFSNNSKLDQAKRQTIHLSKEIDVDQPTTVAQEGLGSRSKRQTTRINQDINFKKSTKLPEEDSMDLSMAAESNYLSQDVEEQNVQDIVNKAVRQKCITMNHKTHSLPLNTHSTATQSKRQTIHFNQNNDLEESLMVNQHRASNDDSTMDLSMQMATVNFDHKAIKVEHMPPTRRTVLIPQNLDESLHTNITQAADTQQQSNYQDDDTMDLSTIVTEKSSSQPKRQTINARRSMDFDDPRTDVDQFNSGHPSSSQISAKSKRQTVHFNQDLDVEYLNDALPQISKIPQRQTIQFDRDIETEFANNRQIASPQVAKTYKRQTVHLNQDLELEANEMVVSPRQTIHCNDDLDVEPSFQVLPQPSKTSKRQTNRDCEVEASNNEGQTLAQTSKTYKRQTVHCNDDLDVEPSFQVLPQTFKTSKRQTIHFNQDLEVELSNEEKVLPQTLKTTKRQTVHINQDMELNDSNTEALRRQAYKASKRETLHDTTPVKDNNQEQVSLRTIRTTKLFDEEEARQMTLFNETKKNTAENAVRISKLNRQTVYFQQNNDLGRSVMESRPYAKSSQDDSTMNLSIVDVEEDQPKALPMPRRLTILGDHPLDVEDSPEKSTARKSSYSRTLNFNEIQTATSNINRLAHVDMDLSIQDRATAAVKGIASSHTTLVEDDSPLYYYSSKVKGTETTAEIDRSLAEYLKAEAAATQFLNNSHDISMDVVNRGQTSCPTEYYDVEDENLSKLRRHTSHEPVNIFEESGMQPLQKSAERRQTPSDSDGIKPYRVDLQAIDEIGRLSFRESEAEDCENFMEISIHPQEPCKPLKCTDNLSRKTVYFTNENAVDESFFDDNLSASQNQKNHQTLFFNDSKSAISDMDQTEPVNKYNAKKSNLKQILLESNMLFSQSRLLKPSTLDSKRSTIYFAGKENSMDMTTAMECESPKVREDQDPCTPTKNKLSRIPQLIDSAKKLLSIKKSMDFIRQELPNFASSRQRADTPERANIPQNQEESFDTVEPVRRAATSVPKKLHEAFNDVDIARRVTIFEPKQLQESFDTIEIPRRVTAHRPSQLQESFEAVEIPRRATTFQKNDTLYLCPDEVDVTTMSQKSLYQMEDAPITISDVSTFFAQKLIPTNDTYSPNTTEALCNLDVHRFSKDDHLPKSSDSEDTAYNFDKFKKRYVELTCDSVVLMDDIEKTHLSLVNTLDEQSELVHYNYSQLPAIGEVESHKARAELEPPTVPQKSNSSVCRKCKGHRLSVTQNDTTIGSFMIEALPEYKMDLAALQDLATKPKISDVVKVWQQKIRESDSFNISDGNQSMASDDLDSVDEFIAELDHERLEAAQQRQRKEIKREASFIHTVRKKMLSNKSNWMLNDLLLAGGVLKFTHTRIRTFAIFISFTPKDSRGVEVNFNDIQLVPNVLHTRQWKPIDYALHYQLLVELPFDLRKLCPTSEGLFQLLQHVEEVTQDVLKTGKDMLYLILTSPASLIRESSGSLYIRKYVRARTPQNEVKRTEFQIEVRNIKKLSYESIAVPPLYEFDEKIQLLPMGQDFLRIFLADPMQYMKA